VNLKIKMIGINKNERASNAKLENTKSKKRSIFTSYYLDTCQSLYGQTQAKVQNII